MRKSSDVIPDVIAADDLLLKLDFRDPDPEIIDLSPEGGLVKTLKECKVECLMPEKVSPFAVGDCRLVEC